MEQTLLTYASVVAIGLTLGRISFRGIRLGVAGVLFAGLVFGHFQLAPDHEILSFAREFGLVLFVFAVGLSVGPGFLNALRRDGLRLNALATAIVAIGVGITLLQMTVLGIVGPVAIGIYSGASTNTPSLAAAGQALREHPPTAERAQQALRQLDPHHPALATDSSETTQEAIMAELTKLPGMSYAVSYPGGVFGIIVAILLLRWLFGIDPVQESKDLDRHVTVRQPTLERFNIKLTNPNLAGRRIVDLPALEELQVTVSRVLRENEEFLAQPDFQLQMGDILSAVGLPERLEEFCAIVGERSNVELLEIPSPLQYRWLTVSRKDVVGRSMEALALGARFGVQVTRVRRADTELPPLANVTLSLADQIRVVGLPENIARVAKEVGDSARQLGEPELVPVFLGIAFGIFAGTLPISLPGIPTTLKLGMAGGPLLVSIALSRIQRIGSLVWYLPPSASLLLKDLGIALFLASVGLKSGDRFLATLLNGSGLIWMLLGLIVTLVPLLTIGIVARIWLKERFAVIVGLLAGSMTDPPALAFAHALTKSEVASVSYATVYPLSMMLRLITAQLLMTWWAQG